MVGHLPTLIFFFINFVEYKNNININIYKSKDLIDSVKVTVL